MRYATPGKPEEDTPWEPERDGLGLGAYWAQPAVGETLMDETREYGTWADGWTFHRWRLLFYRDHGLDAALTTAPRWGAAYVASARRSTTTTRVCDYLLGGSTNFAADRDEAARLLAADPRLPELARQNRAFLVRAVTHVARQDVAQFIDVGAGLPTSPSTHEAAGAVLPEARVAYVDHDPVVIAHTRGLMPLNARVVALPGDLRDPGVLLRDPALSSLIDLTKPVCVLLVAVLHFLDAPTARRVTAAFTETMVPGSYLVLSVGQAAAENASSLYRAYTAARLHHHRRADIEGFFAGLDLLPPGLTEARTWPRPADPGDIDPGATAGEATVLCGVGRKSVRSGATATARSGPASRSTTPAP